MCLVPSTDAPDFQAFCHALRQWVRAAPRPDPALLALADLLEPRRTVATQWFECEVSHLVTQAADTHAALGASVLLGLWRATVRERGLQANP
jgi:hypothetical protein